MTQDRTILRRYRRKQSAPSGGGGGGGGTTSYPGTQTTSSIKAFSPYFSPELPAGATRCTISMWTNAPLSVATDTLLTIQGGSTTTRVSLDLKNTGAINPYSFRNPATFVTSVNSAAGLVTANTWAHILVDLNYSAAAPALKAWVNGASAINTTLSLPADAVFNSVNNISIGSATTKAFAAVWVAFDMALTLDEDGVARFYQDGHPVDLGADGSTPTGSAPFAFYANEYSTFKNDLSGNGYNLSTIGATLSDVPGPS